MVSATNWQEWLNIAAQFENAQMAELVDAADSKSAVRKDVQVRFLFWAQKNLIQNEVFLFPVF